MPENTPKFYLDTCVFIDLIEHGPLSDKGKLLTSLFEDAEARKCELVTSVITIAEVLWAKAEKDGKKVSPKTQQIINALWHPQSSPVRLIDVHEAIARDAQNLLRSHLHKGWTKTGAVDAVALVTARRERAHAYFTTERAMKKWGAVLGFEVCEPRRPPNASTQASPGKDSGHLFDGQSDDADDVA